MVFGGEELQERSSDKLTAKEEEFVFKLLHNVVHGAAHILHHAIGGVHHIVGSVFGEEELNKLAEKLEKRSLDQLTAKEEEFLFNLLHNVVHGAAHILHHTIHGVHMAVGGILGEDKLNELAEELEELKRVMAAKAAKYQ